VLATSLWPEARWPMDHLPRPPDAFRAESISPITHKMAFLLLIFLLLICQATTRTGRLVLALQADDADSNSPPSAYFPKSWFFLIKQIFGSSIAAGLDCWLLLALMVKSQGVEALLDIVFRLIRWSAAGRCDLLAGAGHERWCWRVLVIAHGAQVWQKIALTCQVLCAAPRAARQAVATVALLGARGEVAKDQIIYPCNFSSCWQ